MNFTLFSKIQFEVTNPIALIECFCIQTNFYSSYDLLLPKRTIEDVAKIGARIDKGKLQACKSIIKGSNKLAIFGYDLDDFLNLTDTVINRYVVEASTIINKLMNQGTGLSQALKILHTIYPAIVPMIDSYLQEQYQLHIKPEWKPDNPSLILFDYYINLKQQTTRNNLDQVCNAINLPCLTKIRIFDIIWWSYLRTKKLIMKNNDIRICSII